MKHIIRMAALLACTAAFSLPLASSAQTNSQVNAQTDASTMKHHRDPFMRALHTLSLTDDEKAQIKSFVSASMQANKGATPDQRKANREQLHQQILGILTPEQQQQLNAKLAKR